jgi:hypothetical protein
MLIWFANKDGIHAVSNAASKWGVFMDEIAFVNSCGCSASIELIHT